MVGVCPFSSLVFVCHAQEETCSSLSFSRSTRMEPENGYRMAAWRSTRQVSTTKRGCYRYRCRRNCVRGGLSLALCHCFALNFSLHCFQGPEQQGENWIEVRALIGVPHPPPFHWPYTSEHEAVVAGAHTIIKTRGVGQYKTVHASKIKYG